MREYTLFFQKDAILATCSRPCTRDFSCPGRRRGPGPVRGLPTPSPSRLDRPGPSFPPAPPHPTQDQLQMRTADGPTTKPLPPQKTPSRAYPPMEIPLGFPQGATARFIGQGEPETNQSKSPKERKTGHRRGDELSAVSLGEGATRGSI